MPVTKPIISTVTVSFVGNVHIEVHTDHHAGMQDINVREGKIEGRRLHTLAPWLQADATAKRIPNARFCVCVVTICVQVHLNLFNTNGSMQLDVVCTCSIPPPPHACSQVSTYVFATRARHMCTPAPSRVRKAHTELST
eukprot:6189188-Pleurochrysis_carterae.AAC.2